MLTTCPFLQGPLRIMESNGAPSTQPPRTLRWTRWIRWIPQDPSLGEDESCTQHFSKVQLRREGEKNRFDILV